MALADMLLWSVVIMMMVILPAVLIFYLSYRTRMKELETKLSESEKVSIRESLSSIEHRLQVLEAIVTDEHSNPGRKIDRLR